MGDLGPHVLTYPSGKLDGPLPIRIAWLARGRLQSLPLMAQWERGGSPSYSSLGGLWVRPGPKALCVL